MSKKSKPQRPNRDPDHYSKRGVPYWWAPEWIRGTTGETVFESKAAPASTSAIMLTSGQWCLPCSGYGKIKAIREKNTVNLHMQNATNGKLSYIQGSIQDEFKQWHTDREIDYILLGMDPDELIET